MKEDIKDFLTSKGVEWEEVADLRVSHVGACPPVLLP